MPNLSVSSSTILPIANQSAALRRFFFFLCKGERGLVSLLFYGMGGESESERER